MTDESFLARVSKLERQNRRLRILLVVGALVGLGLAAGVVESFRELADISKYGLRTSGVAIVDPAGAVMTSLGRSQERPYFKFVDHAGRFRMFLALEEDGPVLTLSDAAGKPRTRIAARDSGGTIEILDAEGKKVWSAP